MMYSWMRVMDPNTRLYKNVLVNWVSLLWSSVCPYVMLLLFAQSGEGVLGSRRGMCARHTSDVASFFRVSAELAETPVVDRLLV